MKIMDLENVIAEARRRFLDLKKRFPQMKAYLVLSSPHGQCEVSASPESDMT